jgi:hypothetical protein
MTDRLCETTGARCLGECPCAHHARTAERGKAVESIQIMKSEGYRQGVNDTVESIASWLRQHPSNVGMMNAPTCAMLAQVVERGQWSAEVDAWRRQRRADHSGSAGDDNG